jgi:hypothetical protein
MSEGPGRHKANHDGAEQPETTRLAIFSTPW